VTRARRDTDTLLAGACWLALLAVGLMSWSLFDPRPLPVVVAMSVGQVLGTLSLLSFVFVVFVDWRTQAARARQLGGPP